MVVSGYIRNNYKEDIPSSIITICVMYFLNLIGKCSSNIILSGVSNQNIVCNDGDLGIAYTSFWIHSLSKKVITCKILVNHQSSEKYSSMNSIGITSKDIYLVNESLQEAGNTYYCLSNDGDTIVWPEDIYEYVVVKLIINSIIFINKGIITYYINDDLNGISIENIKQDETTKYKLFIQIWAKNDSFTIIDFFKHEYVDKNK